MGDQVEDLVLEVMAVVLDSAPEDQEDRATALEDQVEDLALEVMAVVLDSVPEDQEDIVPEDQVEDSALEDQEDQLTALEDQAEDSAQEDTVEAQDSALEVQEDQAIVPEDQAEDSAPEDTGDLPGGEALAAVDRDMESRYNSSTTCIQGSRKILPDPFFCTLYYQLYCQ